PQEPADAKPGNPFHPFSNRHAFDWAQFHFFEIQASNSKTNRGLDLWQAALISSGGTTSIPWASAKEVRTTIDSIQESDIPWKMVQFHYSGSLPNGTPPKWMTETYELCVHDSHLLLQQQLTTTVDKFNPTAYRQFNKDRNQVYSNRMSANWAWTQSDIIAEDPRTHGAMFVPVIAGSDKTTVSVATGHQEYHYESHLWVSFVGSERNCGGPHWSARRGNSAG
ncbi:hypothetical protein C8J56DRAFT_799124, partial [Mycena floridula]